MSLDKFNRILAGDRDLKPFLAHHEIIEACQAEFSETSTPLNPHLAAGLRADHIDRLYSHQVEAIDKVLAGKNIVAVTPTASGKSLLYNLPVLQHLAENPEQHAVYIFPLKALEQDQANKLKRLIQSSGWEDRISVGIYDGDTPSNLRMKMRKNPPNILVTNPDMLHLAVMSYHSSWEDLLRGLKFIVLDELHVYRGIFGSHILHVLHRLLRLCHYYGVNPQVIATSATIAGAKELAQDLTGLPFEIIENSGAPTSQKHFFFFNPSGSYLTFALRIFTTALSQNLKTIMFTKARRTTELLHMWLNQTSGDLGRKVSSYRAGFMPEERREIESRLLDGTLIGVISTSALELGIDIGGLDVCVLVGYPGTISGTWQRAGRVGRGSLPAAVCLIAGQDQLDQYFMRNPRDFFGRPVERAIVDSTNEYILKPHIICAAQEIPISRQDAMWDSDVCKPILDELTRAGELLLGASGDRYFSARRRPQRRMDIRASGDQFVIELKGGSSSLGSVSGRSVYAECHPGAVYLHRAQQYLVTKLDEKAKRVEVRRLSANFYTNALFEKETEILEDYKKLELAAGYVKLVKLKVTEQLVGYQKRKFSTQELISQHELEYPPRSFETIGLALSIPGEAMKVAAADATHFRGGIHGAEHSLLGLAPLFALCDRNDLGGYSQLAHPQLKGPSVFLYDGYPGGIGLAARLFDVFQELVTRTAILVRECECDTGCPSCIHSPKCGHGNIPLDKKACVMVLEIISGVRDLQVAAKSDVEKIEISAGTNDKSAKPVTIQGEMMIPKKETPDAWNPLKRGVVFDLETQRSADDVGGWNNIRSMGLAWAVAYRFPEDEWLDFAEKDVDGLIDVLRDSDLVVGFNHVRFDYEVLRAYTGFDFRKLNDYDILAEITQALGHRLTLGSVAGATLGASKSADGLQSLQWWKEGLVEKVAEYCRQDVAVTRDLFFYIFEHGYLLFEKRDIGLVRIPMRQDPFK